MMCERFFTHYTHCEHNTSDREESCPFKGQHCPVIWTIDRDVDDYCTKECMWDHYLWKARRREKEKTANAVAVAKERAMAIFGEEVPDIEE